MEAAALQYVRKVSGLQRVPKEDEAAFAEAVRQVTLITQKLLKGLTKKGEPRTRDGEIEKARAKWKQREAALAARFMAVSR